jgi:hypothetical protein
MYILGFILGIIGCSFTFMGLSYALTEFIMRQFKIKQDKLVHMLLLSVSGTILALTCAILKGI